MSNLHASASGASDTSEDLRISQGKASVERPPVNGQRRPGAPTDSWRDTSEFIFSKIRALKKPIKGTELCLLTGQLALMLEAGSSLVETLEALTEQTQNEKTAQVLRRISGEVSGGAPLSKALRAHPRVFREFYVSAVMAGESGGGLSQVFSRLEDFLLKRERLFSTLRNALIYPAVLLFLTLGAVTFLVSFVLPRFIAIFSSTGAILPLPTRMLLALAGFCQNYWYLLVLFLGAAGVGACMILANPKTRPYLYRLFLRLPLAGPLIVSFQSSSFLRITGTLLNSGVPVIEAIALAQHACTNSLFRNSIARLTLAILQGDGFSSTFSKMSLFPPMVRQMVVTGERTGKLSRTMTRMADYLDENSEKQLKRLSALAEPLIIILMGVVIGFIAISMLLPLFRLSSIIKGGA
ncbi:type II secretion system F family protein [bacterium]|nr:type II secretion system F family protein [bacterium]